MRKKISELQRHKRFAERDAARGMIELRGWDPQGVKEKYPSPIRGSAVVIECREPGMIKIARRLNVGNTVEYTVERKSFRQQTGSTGVTTYCDHKTPALSRPVSTGDSP